MVIRLEQGDLTIRYIPVVGNLNQDTFNFYIEQGENLIILTHTDAAWLVKNIKAIIDGKGAA